MLPLTDSPLSCANVLVCFQLASTFQGSWSYKVTVVHFFIEEWTALSCEKIVGLNSKGYTSLAGFFNAFMACCFSIYVLFIFCLGNKCLRAQLRNTTALQIPQKHLHIPLGFRAAGVRHLSKGGHSLAALLISCEPISRSLGSSELPEQLTPTKNPLCWLQVASPAVQFAYGIGFFCYFYWIQSIVACFFHSRTPFLI